MSTCVWLDEQPTNSDESLVAQGRLQSLCEHVHTFDDRDRCVDFISERTEERLVLSTTNVLAKILIPLIHSWEQIHSVYLFDSLGDEDGRWTRDYPKIHSFVDNSMALSYFSSTLHRQEPSFMYFQLLKDILLHDTSADNDDEAKSDMLNFCRKTFTHTPSTLALLDEFQEEFLPSLAIDWYTRECFLYRMLNKALWTPEPEVLYKFRYFLRHLHAQISSVGASQRQRSTSMILYRGQSLTREQLDQLQSNRGGFLSFNNFLSTSMQRHVADNFLFGAQIGVLFEMHIDPSIDKFPFADIGQLSSLHARHDERELLFSMGTVFRIVHIEHKEQVYHVQLTLSDQVDEQLQEYTKVTREQVRSSHSFLSLIKLMEELGQLDRVEYFVDMLNDKTLLNAHPFLLASIHHSFGMIYLSRGQPDQALQHFHHSLNIYLQNLPANDPKLSPTYNNIGSVYLSQLQYDEALTFHQLALDCQRNAPMPDQSSIIAYLNNIGSIYFRQGNFREALSYHQQALQLQQEHLGANDLQLINTYNVLRIISLKLEEYEQASLYHDEVMALQRMASIVDPTALAHSSITTGVACLSHGQHNDALTHFQEALQIEEQFLLPNNPSLAATYNLVAKAHYEQKQFDEALQFYLKALEIERTSLADDHPSIATSYHNISTAYAGLKQWSLALEYAIKSVERLKNAPQADPHVLALFIHSVGYLYQQQGDVEMAIPYYEEAFALYERRSTENDASLATIFHQMASAYYQLKIYDKALVLYQKTLAVMLKTLPENAETIATIYSNLSTAHLGLRQFDEAHLAAEQALFQLRKTLPEDHPDVERHIIFLRVIEMSQTLGIDVTQLQ